MNYWEYADYASEITMIEEILAKIPPDKPARIMAFTNRLNKAKAKIEGIPVPERPVELNVAFYGGPVLNDPSTEPGIQAGFTAEALNQLTLAIDLTAAGALSELQPTGGISRKGFAPTYITSVSPGSFGFTLQIQPDKQEETPPAQSLAQTRAAVSLIQDLLEAAATGDEEQLTQATNRMNQRAINKVADFMGLLKRADATLAVAFQGQRVHLDSSDLVEKTAERLSNNPPRPTTRTVTGTLRGISPAIRHFELRQSEDNSLIQGKIGSAIRDPDQVAEEYIGKVVAAEIQTFQLRNGTPVHTLTKVGAPEELLQEEQ